MSSHPDEISGATGNALDCSELIYRIEQQLADMKSESVVAYYRRILKTLKRWWKKGTVTAKTSSYLQTELLFTYKSCKRVKFMISVAHYSCEVIVKYKRCCSDVVIDNDFTEALGIIEECGRTTPLSRYGYTCQSCELTMDVEALAALTDKLIVDVEAATPTDHDKTTTAKLDKLIEHVNMQDFLDMLSAYQSNKNIWTREFEGMETHYNYHGQIASDISAFCNDHGKFYEFCLNMEDYLLRWLKRDGHIQVRYDVGFTQMELDFYRETHDMSTIEFSILITIRDGNCAVHVRYSISSKRVTMLNLVLSWILSVLRSYWW